MGGAQDLSLGLNGLMEMNRIHVIVISRSCWKSRARVAFGYQDPALGAIKGRAWLRERQCHEVCTGPSGFIQSHAMRFGTFFPEHKGGQ